MPSANLRSFEGHEDDIPLWIAQSWADSTRRMLEMSKERRKTYFSLCHMYERMDGDGITTDSVEAAMRDVWSTDCLLILSAANLETWIAKLYRVRSRKAPKPHPNLAHLRNAIEHLEEAELDNESSTAFPRTRQSRARGIGALPGQELLIGLTGDGKLFGVISHDELEALAMSLLDELDAELQAYAMDHLAAQLEDG